MARTHGPLFSLTAEGRLGTAIQFQRGPGGTNVRPYKAPTQNPSPSQRATQLLSRYLSKRWPRLSTAHQATWQNTAQADHTTPWGSYQRRNHMRWMNGSFPTDAWPPAETGQAFDLNPRSTLVTVSPTTEEITGSPNCWGTNPQYQWFHWPAYDRIRQSCTLRQIRVSIGSKPAQVQHWCLEIWRHSGTTYDLVDRQDLWPYLTVGSPCVLTLPTPMPVLEGDYVGYHYSSSSNNTTFMRRNSGTQNFQARYRDTDHMPDVDANWDAQTIYYYRVSLHLLATAPWMIAIGDSLTSGSPYHTTYWTHPSTPDQDDLQTTAYPPQLAALLGCESQNTGKASDTAAGVLARWPAQVTSQHPQLAFLLIGVNDLALSTPKATYLANIQSILALAAADNSAVALLSILPWTAGSTSSMRARDDWNAELAAIAAASANAIYLPVADALAQNRPGGDPGNLWDIKTAYDYDGVHLTQAGYAALAQETHRQLCATQHAAQLPTNADDPTHWLLGLRLDDQDIAGFSIHRSTSELTELTRLNCVAIRDPYDPARGLYVYTDRPPPGTYHYRAAAFSTSGKLLYTTPNRQITIT